ncbi:MAG: adenylate/guanylate cyclase domain-containing protein, partial [Actinomycetota bacterium]|nr:adenylate/guanylate cyclase domain-containing protein [Actinomycetota bacterium]
MAWTHEHAPVTEPETVHDPVGQLEAAAAELAGIDRRRFRRWTAGSSAARRVRNVVGLATRIGSDPHDSSEQRLRKALLVSVSLMVIPAGALWGTLYWAFGERTAALVPWGYVVASVACLAGFALTRSFRFLRAAELLLILVAPFALMLLLGGLTASSGVILWSFLAPLGAIVFDRPRRAWLWFAAFLALILAGVPLAPLVRPTDVVLSDDVVLAFGAMNIIAPSLISFTLLVTFARQREAAQQRVEDLLLNILPEEIANRLQDERQRIADHFDSASILFADVVDFTPLSACLAPAEVVDLLDRLFTDFDELVDRYGLEKIKTIGDAYMVVAGVPRPRPDHAHVLARMALEMRDCANRYLRPDGPGNLQLRIGINSGPVVAGVIGRRRFLYDLWG